MEGKQRRTLVAAAAVAVLLAPQAAHAAPQTLHTFANRCFAAVSVAGGKFVAAAGDGYSASAKARRRAMPLYFKPTGLGTYMVHDRDGRLLSAGEGDSVVRAGLPGPAAEWAPLERRPGAFALRSTSRGREVTVKADGSLATAPIGAGRRSRFRFAARRGCRRYPEAALGAKGRPARGRRRDGSVFGYADAHLHVTSDLRAGGQVVSGRAFDPFGITEALGRDADVHGPDGSLDVTGNLLRDGSPNGTHDTEGWPSFAGWPVYDTYTHQQVYYRWLERAYMAGLRVVTAQLVEDKALCEIEPRKSHSCDEDDTVALEAERMRELEGYVDAQNGGPGRGWMRLVTSPRQARRAIARGQMAVLLGVEASGPFGCTELQGQPQCDREDIDEGIERYKRLGISGMFVAHWVNNAFAGASVEEGATGDFIAAFNVAQTGRPFQTGPCPQEGYGEDCNVKGLTELGEYFVNRLMDNHMLIEMDHLSERARLRVLEIAEARGYPLVSSHTNSGGFWTQSDLERLYALGGFTTARPDTAAKLARTIVSFRRYKQKGEPLGVGIGSDTGGFAAAPEPDPAAEQRPLRYPFRSYDGKVKFVCQVTGERKFDLNKDGVAHYGMYADLLAYMRQQTGGKEASRLLFRSAEAYLRMWERAHRSGSA